MPYITLLFFVRKHWKKILVMVFLLLSTIFIFFFSYQEPPSPPLMPNINLNTTAKVSPLVLRYEPVIKQYMNQFGISSDYLPVIEALIQQESGGKLPDVMQSSESKGLPPNTIKDPIESIQTGLLAFKDRLTKAAGDIKLVLQSYNFGSGFIDYVKSNGGKFTQTLVDNFSTLQAKLHGWVRYGDVNYVQHVLQYLQPSNISSNIKLPSGQGVQSYFQNFMHTALQFQGMPYHFGGSAPSTSFDCSGLMQYVFKQNGINLPRTAQEQYDATQRISKDQLKPGDFVFFTKTYNTPNYITHVGLYVGNNTIYAAGGKGVDYYQLTGSLATHLAGFGRLK